MTSNLPSTAWSLPTTTAIKSVVVCLCGMVNVPGIVLPDADRREPKLGELPRNTKFMGKTTRLVHLRRWDIAQSPRRVAPVILKRARYAGGVYTTRKQDTREMNRRLGREIATSHGRFDFQTTLAVASLLNHSNGLAPMCDQHGDFRIAIGFNMKPTATL